MDPVNNVPDTKTATVTSPRKISPIPPAKPPRLSSYNSPDLIASGINAIKFSQSVRLSQNQENQMTCNENTNKQGKEISVKDRENSEHSQDIYMEGNVKDRGNSEHKPDIYNERNEKDREISEHSPDIYKESEKENISRTKEEHDEESQTLNSHKSVERRTSAGSMLFFASPGRTNSLTNKFSPLSALIIPTGSFQTEHSTTTDTEIEMSISAKNLGSGIMKGRVSPRCIVSIKDDADGDFREVGRTETLRNQSSPLWIQKIILSHQSNLVQSLRMSLYNWTNEQENIDKQELLGHINTTLDLLVNLDGNQLCLPLKNGKGSVLVNCDPVSNSKEEITLEFGGIKLANMDVFSKSDPFLIIYRRSTGSNNTFIPVHRTETIMDNLNPVWKGFSIPGGLLCGGDHYRMIKIECYDWDTDGGHDLIGECYTTLSRLLSGPSADNEYELKKPRSDKESNNSRAGKLILKSISSNWESAFLNHISGGTSLQWTIAIDFSITTGSEQLHSAREFMFAMADLKNVMKKYQKGEDITAFGFLGGNKGIFSLKKEANDMAFRNVDDICEAYQKVWEKGVAEGSTSDIAAPLKHIFPKIQGHQDGTNYHVLIILTGPGNRDTSEMSQLLLEASVLPVSVVIIGIGDGDFQEFMKFEHSTNFGHGTSMRNTVNFLARNDLLNKSCLNKWSAEFSREALKYLPQQLVTWKRMKGIKPGVFRKNSAIP